MSGCVLDTDVVIAALDRADAQHERAADLFRIMSNENVRLSMSAVNYAEVLVRPSLDDMLHRAAVNAMRKLGIKVVAPGSAVAQAAVRLRARHNISLADCFALATASREDSRLASFDAGVRKVAGGERIGIAG